MSQLHKEILKLTNPTPDIFDPEDDIIDSHAIESNIPSEVDEFVTSRLRSKNAPLIEDIDSSYRGRKVSRKSLGDDFQNKKEASSKSTESDFSDSNESDDVDEMDIDEFNSLMPSKSSAGEELNSEDSDSVDEGSSEFDEENSDNSEQDGNAEEENMLQQLSNIDVSGELEKGQAVKNQKEIWNRVLESRIKLQKLLVSANKLPQLSVFQELKEQGGKSLIDDLNKGCNALRMALNLSLELQSELECRVPTIETTKDSKITEAESQSDEEIPSDTDDETPSTKQSDSDITEKSRKGLKRKSNFDDYGMTLAKKFEILIPYRNSVIQKWEEKTRLSAGRMTQKSFSAFENSALKQIEQILQDKNRLIKRTQLKRSLYTVIGKKELEEVRNDDDTEKISKQDILLRDYDVEIFDDDDFYRQLLKDVIESKSFGMDPSVLQKQMEIQKIRNKMKKKVDTKASKGRKLRFDVHPKLVNLMAPVQISTMPDDSRDNLLKCIFGKTLNC